MAGSQTCSSDPLATCSPHEIGDGSASSLDCEEILRDGPASISLSSTSLAVSLVNISDVPSDGELDAPTLGKENQPGLMTEDDEEDGCDNSPPPVPCNSPDEKLLSNTLRAEGIKQERYIQARLQERSLSEIFNIRKMLPRPKKRSRKAREHLEPGSVPANDAKEANPLIGFQDLVPGLDLHSMTLSEGLERTREYLTFLKRNVGSRYDNEFLKN